MANAYGVRSGESPATFARYDTTFPTGIEGGAAADFDGDDKTDAVVHNGNELIILGNQADAFPELGRVSLQGIVKVLAIPRKDQKDDLAIVTADKVYEVNVSCGSTEPKVCTISFDDNGSDVVVWARQGYRFVDAHYSTRRRPEGNSSDGELYLPYSERPPAVFLALPESPGATKYAVERHWFGSEPTDSSWEHSVFDAEGQPTDGMIRVGGDASEFQELARLKVGDTVRSFTFGNLATGAVETQNVDDVCPASLHSADIGLVGPFVVACAELSSDGTEITFSSGDAAVGPSDGGPDTDAPTLDETSSQVVQLPDGYTAVGSPLFELSFPCHWLHVNPDLVEEMPAGGACRGGDVAVAAFTAVVQATRTKADGSGSERVLLRIIRAYQHDAEKQVDGKTQPDDSAVLSSPTDYNWRLQSDSGEDPSHNRLEVVSEPEDGLGSGSDPMVRIPLSFAPIRVKWAALDAQGNRVPEGKEVPWVRRDETDPIIIAVLASPPQVQGARQEPSAMPEFNRSRSQGSSTGTTTSSRFRGMIGFDAGVGIGPGEAFSTGAGFEASFEEEVTVGTSISKEVTIADSYFGSLDDHTIVYWTTEVYVFEGEVVESSNGLLLGEKLTATLPGDTFVSKAPFDSFVSESRTWKDVYGSESGKLYGSLQSALEAKPGDPGSYPEIGEEGGYCLTDQTHRFTPPPTLADRFQPPPNPFEGGAPPKLGEPRILKSAIHSVVADDDIAGGEGATITFESGAEESFARSTSFDFDAYVQAGGVKAGMGFGFTFGKEWTTTWGEGTGFLGFVGDIPSSKLKGEEYKWQMFVCKRGLEMPNGAVSEIWIQHYAVQGYDGTGGLVEIEPPEPAYPRHGQRVLGPDLSVRWEHLGTVASYRIEVEGVSVDDSESISGPSYANTAAAAERPSQVTAPLETTLEVGELYRWRAVATDFFGTETPGPWAFFRTAGAPTGEIRTSVARGAEDARPAIAGEAVSFGVAVTDDGGSPLTGYEWDFGDGASSNDAAPTHTFESPGTYPVLVTISNAAGSETLSRTIRIEDPSPVSDFRYTPEDPSTATTISFIDESTDDLAPAGATVSRAWDFGDGSATDGTSVSHRYDGPGIYPVTLTVTSDHGGQTFSHTTTRFVRVADGRPIPNFTFSPQSPSTTDTVVFTDLSRDDNEGDLSAHWDFGDGESGVGSTVEHRYTEPGVYEVNLVSFNPATDLYDAIRRPIGVAEFVPSPDFVFSDAPSTAADVAFTFEPSPDQPTPDSRTYTWDFGDGTTGTGPNPTHRYAEPGSYTVRLEVIEDHGGEFYTGWVMRTVHVADGSPTAAFSFAPLRPSTADTITFHDRSIDPDPDARLVAGWDFGDGNSASGPAPTHRYEEPGSYEVVLEVRNPDSGLASRITRTISVSDGTPIPFFRWSPTEVSTADEVGFEPQATDPGDRSLTYRWQVDEDPAVDGAAALSAYRFDEPGTHEISMRVTNDAGLSAELVRSLYVTDGSPIPDVYTGGGFTSVPTEFRDLSADPGDRDLAYRWNWGDGSPDTVWGLGERPTDRIARHLYSRPGTYTVTLTLTNDAGLETSKVFFVEIQDGTPRADFLISPESATTSIFVRPQDRSVDPAGLELAYRWDFGDGTSSTERYPSHNYAEPGVYVIELTVKNPAGQFHTVTRKVRVEPGNPIADFTWAPTHPVTLDEVVFTSDSRDPAGLPLSYEWDFGDGTLTAAGAEVTHTFDRPGSHPVTLTVTNAAGEIDTAVLTVPVRNRAAQAAFSWTPDRPWLLDPVRFADESVDPDGSVVAWRWDFGDGESSSEQHPEHQYERCGVYRVNLMVWDDSGAVSTYTDDVRISLYPGVPGQEPVCVAPPPKQSPSVDGRPTVEVDESPYYLSSPMGGALEITGRAWGGESPLRNVVVTIGEGSGRSVFTRPYDAAGRWRAQFDDFLLPGEYPVEVTAFDENDVASLPVRMTILVL